MKRYEKYKDSGVEWLGEVPEHWTIYKLNFITNKIRNGFVGVTRGIIKTKGVLYIQGMHIKKNGVQFTPNGDYFVSQEWSNNHEKSILRELDR